MKANEKYVSAAKLVLHNSIQKQEKKKTSLNNIPCFSIVSVYLQSLEYCCIFSSMKDTFKN